MSQSVLVAGASGYLGQHIIQQLKLSSFSAHALVRDAHKADRLGLTSDQIHVAESVYPTQLQGVCDGIDTVISCMGITRQKDGLQYRDVDYQANLNLLREAQRAGVRKFIYVSVLNGPTMRHLAICDAKEAFVDELTNSDMAHCIIRPNGFYSDIAEIFKMARNGRVYLFGRGDLRLNPIHGLDLARFCIEQINGKALELDVGGPDTFSQQEIAELAFSVCGQRTKITHLPDGARLACLWLGKHLLSSSRFGPIEFFLDTLGREMLAPAYGQHHLADFFAQLHQSANLGERVTR